MGLDVLILVIYRENMVNYGFFIKVFVLFVICVIIIVYGRLIDLDFDGNGNFVFFIVGGLNNLFDFGLR